MAPRDNDAQPNLRKPNRVSSMALDEVFGMEHQAKRGSF